MLSFRMITFSAVAVELAILSACAPQRVQATADQQQTVCKANKFLQKYNCSLDRIEETAATGDPDAEYALGYMYYYGINTTRDAETGKVWIQRAAHQGQPLAMQALSLLNEKQYPDMAQIEVNNQFSTPSTLRFADKTQKLRADSHQITSKIPEATT